MDGEGGCLATCWVSLPPSVRLVVEGSRSQVAKINTTTKQDPPLHPAILLQSKIFLQIAILCTRNSPTIFLQYKIFCIFIGCLSQETFYPFCMSNKLWVYFMPVVWLRSVYNQNFWNQTKSSLARMSGGSIQPVKQQKNRRILQRQIIKFSGSWKHILL